MFFISGGQSDFTIELHVKKYVEKGSSVTLFCEHTVADEDLYKVRKLLLYYGSHDCVIHFPESFIFFFGRCQRGFLAKRALVKAI